MVAARVALRPTFARPVRISARKLHDNSVTQSELEAEARRFGPTVSVWVARSPPGFASIEFEEADDAQACIDGLDGIRLGTQNCRVEYATNISGERRAAALAKCHARFLKWRAIIKNLPPSFGWRMLKDEVRKIIDVIYADVDPNGSGDGIVEFACEEDLEYAIARLDGARVGGNVVDARREERGDGRLPGRGLEEEPSRKRRRQQMTTGPIALASGSVLTASASILTAQIRRHLLITT